MRIVWVGLFLLVSGVFSVFLLREQKPEKPLTPLQLGRKLVEGGSCRGCHQLGSGYRAPRLEGLLGKERKFIDGSKLLADEAYLLESLLKPRERIVYGYSGTMPSFAGVYSEKEREAIVLYLAQLKDL